MSTEHRSRIDDLLARGELVVLDGGVASAVARERPTAAGLPTPPPDTWAIYDATSRVLDVHRQYAAAGCDVVSTNTWGLLAATSSARGRKPAEAGLPAWTAATRDAVKLARQGIADAGRTGECSVAFCLNDADPMLDGEQQLLSLLWTATPPDLVLIETVPGLPSASVQHAVTEVAASGMPVWVSFRWTAGPPDGYRTALRALEAAGVGAFLVNCIEPAQTADLVDALVRATDLPIGCYPRLQHALDPDAFATMARRWREQGAGIIGGCCGVGPAHVAAVRSRLAPARHAAPSS